MNRIGREQLLSLQKKYHTDAAIAEFYGVTRQAIYKLRKKYGIPAYERSFAGRNTHIRLLYRQGLSVEKIARRYRVSQSSVYRILREEALGNRVYDQISAFLDAHEGSLTSFFFLAGTFSCLAADILYKIEQAQKNRSLVALVFTDDMCSALSSSAPPYPMELRNRCVRLLSPAKTVYIHTPHDLELLSQQIYFFPSLLKERILAKTDREVHERFQFI
ncbi:helix-turn-helix domain-containing protein [Chitinivibrio alkaliphilus]|uniref:Resolvase HTH domain-containing protein n=1 Tax=Chitinivibrio alkaliphilus ACht1 TaxID=1313304 RepID=U7D3Y2_9BACT|nr:helix-turn-helix domain-containing protein [Chitinivibrio alkaliphilus]ERP31214.1 hypothetical protein CALK_1927 [Chitinivibrio alkaliphilus ACht1]